VTTSTGDALRDRHRPAHARRTAESHAGFLLPLLKPGMAVLDVGCGPGSITVGLAAVVAPGPVCAVDLDPALADGTDGIRVLTADAADLPLDDASFDVIFICATLQHLPDPLAALREARRVARPGAVIAVADADWGGHLLEPSNLALGRSFDLMGRLRTGSPNVGRALRGLLTQAGFERCEVRAKAVHHGTADEVRGFAGFNASWFSTPAIVDEVVRRGWASRDELAATERAWREWGEDPGAFFAGFWCEALAWAGVR
jgi:SAM-dependent methyltransferase